MIGKYCQKSCDPNQNFPDFDLMAERFLLSEFSEDANMIYREIFENVEPARDYATRMTVSDAPAYEFDLSNTEIDQLQGGKAIVLLVGHDSSDNTAIVLTRKDI